MHRNKFLAETESKKTLGLIPSTVIFSFICPFVPLNQFSF
uniref:Uncharacterized protein n=1 Tax=Anguilla anguilla TaxID=7936 RepID=A0A0E9XJ47_ANGAN